MLNPSPSRRQLSPFTQVPVRHAPADLSGIERGGAAWGEAYKGIGQQIEKYGLKKEQQKKDKGTLKGIIQTLDLHASTDTSQSAHIYAAEKADLEDEEKPLSQRLAQGVERLRGMNVTSMMQSRDAITRAQNINTDLAEELKESHIKNADLLTKLNEAKVDLIPTEKGLAQEKLEQERLKTWHVARDKKIVQMKDNFKGGIEDVAMMGMAVDDLKKGILEGTLTKLNIENLMLSAPPGVTAILQDNNKRTDAIWKTPVKLKDGRYMPFSEYMDLWNASERDENLYPLVGEGAVGTLQGNLYAQLNEQTLITGNQLENKTLLFEDGKVDGDDKLLTGDLPPEIDPSSTPKQAAVSARKKATEMQGEISDLTMELESLGEPGSTMSAGFYGDPYGMGTRRMGSETSKKQSVGHIRERKVEIPKQIAALQERIKALAESGLLSPRRPAMIPPQNPAATGSSAIGWGNSPTP